MATKIILLCLFLFAGTLAQKQWTGTAGDSLWSSANNWEPKAVPTSSDDVVINVLGGANVQVSQPAEANSVTLAGGQYPQSLILLSQLSVGGGGITVKSGGTLQVQSNNNLPLESQGSVQFAEGSSFVFESGAITGPGDYEVQAGATLTFSQAAEKLISAANLTNWGSATFQASTIELEKSGWFSNYANLTVIGAVNIFSTDNTGQFNNYGEFDYQGSAGVLLNFQLNTNFYSDLYINGGDVTLDYNFMSNSSVDVPEGSTLTIAAGPTVKQFNVIKGNGELVVQGTAIVTAPISLATLTVTDPGLLTFNQAASFTSGTIEGTLTVQASTAFTNLSLAGGTLTGPGTTVVSGYLWIDTSDTGNTDNFLSSTLVLEGVGMSIAPIDLLFGSGGQFHIASNASYDIQNTFSFMVQGGKPLIIIDGTVSTTGDITTTVDISGAGALKFNAGNLVANGNTITIAQLFLATGTTATLNTVVITTNSVSGAGSLNLTAAPAPVSTLSSVALSYFGLVNGAASVGSFAVTTFDIWGGVATLSSGSANTASEVNIYGGTITGAAKLTTSALNLNLYFPAVLSGIAIKTNSLTIMSQGPGTIDLQNGATIISDSSMVGYTRSNVVIN